MDQRPWILHRSLFLPFNLFPPLFQLPSIVFYLCLCTVAGTLPPSSGISPSSSFLFLFFHHHFLLDSLSRGNERAVADLRVAFVGAGNWEAWLAVARISLVLHSWTRIEPGKDRSVGHRSEISILGKSLIIWIDQPLEGEYHQTSCSGAFCALCS